MVCECQTLETEIYSLPTYTLHHSCKWQPGESKTFERKREIVKLSLFDLFNDKARKAEKELTSHPTSYRIIKGKPVTINVK